MSMIRDALSLYFLISGLFFFISTGVAMFRFPDVYFRLHAGSKCLAGGSLSLLLAYMLQTDDFMIILKLVLITFFLLITNPVAGHALARTAYNLGCCGENLSEDEYGEDLSSRTIQQEEPGVDEE